VEGSATSGSDDRRNRATTVWPSEFVKLTKNLRVVAASGGKLKPSNPCSPPDRIADLMSMKSAARTAPPLTTRIRPACSTTN
jgi:hypothetical protein